MKPKRRYDIVVFEEKDFEHFFDSHRETYAKHFGTVRIVPKLAVILSLLEDKMRDIETLVRGRRLSQAEVSNVLEELQRQSIVQLFAPIIAWPGYEDLVTDEMKRRIRISRLTEPFTKIATDY